VNAFRISIVVVATMLSASCALQPAAPPAPRAREPLPITPPAEVRSAPVARVPVEPTAVPPAASSTSPSIAQAPLSVALALPFPANVLYMCVTGTSGQPEQTAIEFAPKVGELCRRHPEMGPCQYERDVCRRAGGRVFGADGREITRVTEAEYDKKVLRVRFRGD
jgi:hypothetical protein